MTTFELPTSGLVKATLLSSENAADKIAPVASTAREKVFDYIKATENNGATDKEIQAILNMSGDTERPRRWELWLGGRIKVKRDSVGNPIKRNKQTVWVIGEESENFRTNYNAGSASALDKGSAPVPTV